ncbi:phage major tail tube protein [Oceanidesulfovibrio marinus]|uniref:Phage tail protein n=1 Tax=Oceanidesulfovibrio marinus TaxID=370038 RepID=A0ABX6NHX7_9BACT|nr:phage major tail tube protein [Oceanidesulfovibrio marinus]QJT10231.1 phage tail protein [Oceanidesulfovibrio marinus]
MANVNKIPEKTITFNVYKDGAVLMGVATVELPQLQAMTEPLSGAGIAGEIDSPTLGQFQSMSAKLAFRTKTANFIQLQAPEYHHLDLRAAVQHHDGGTGKIEVISERVILRGMPKSASLGKFETAKPQDSELELEISYLKYVQDGQEILELDKLNYIFMVDGTDHLAAVRAAVGEEA